MADIFVNQTVEIILHVTTKADLSQATLTRILFTRPDKTTGYWPATVEKNTFKYKTLTTDLNMPGVWTFQPYYEATAQKGFGTFFKTEILKPSL